MKFPSKGWIWIILALAGLAAAGFIFRGFFMQQVIMPIALLIWAIARIFLSIDQEVYWIALVFAAFVLGLGLLPVRSNGAALDKDAQNNLSGKRFLYWRKIIVRSTRSREERAVLNANLRDLAVNVIAMEEQEHPNAVRDAILHRRLDLPEDIRDFLAEGERRREPTAGKGLPGWFARMRKQPTAADVDIERLLEFLERYTETKDDHRLNSENG